MATRMIQRRGTAAEWTSANPVLAAGEIGFETDTAKFKFGDGTTIWDSLKYYTSIDDIVDGAPDLLNTLNELAAAIGDDANFITTITADISTKLDAAGGTISGNLIVQQNATVGGTLSTSTAPTNPVDVTNKEYVDTQVNNVSLDVDSLDDRTTATESNVSDLQSRTTSLEADVTANAADIATNLGSLTELRSDFTVLPKTYVGQSTPTSADNDGNDIEAGSLWYDLTNGNVHILVELDETNSVWVDTSGPNVIAATPGTNLNDFPVAPANGDTHEGYIYNSTQNAWQVDRSIAISEINEIESAGATDDSVLMYNSTTSKFEVVDGVRLDGSSLIPLRFLTLVQDAAAVDSQALVDNVVDNAASNFDTLGKVATYLNDQLLLDVAPLTVKTAADWSTDTNTPLAGSLNVETGGAEVRAKIGNGLDVYANLSYIPSNAGITSEIANAIAPLAPKANPTFSGTASLPSTTSIGNVSDAEIAHLDGVTSGIQGQLDDLDTLKAPIANPTFTGTVSGIDKTMVGLSSVDNTADTDKPVSTAQQTALDTKLNLAGGTMTGKITLDGDPTQALHAVTKQYVDSVEAGLITRPAVKAATTANLSGTYTNGTDGVDAQLNLGQLATLDIDGVTSWSQWNGILVKDQTNGFENGRYVVLQVGNDTDTDWILKRCPLCDEADEIPGSYIFVTDGVTNEQTGWVQHVADPSTFVVGTDDIDVYQFAGSGAVTAGTNISVSGTQVSVLDAPTFAGTVDASASGIAFSDGTQTQAGVPSLTTFIEKTASYQLDTLDHKDNVVEMNMSTAGTFIVPLDATLAWPVGASMDIFATGTGEITIAAEAGVTLNATPGLTLRTQWSSATIMKRGANNWVVYGDLKA